MSRGKVTHSADAKAHAKRTELSAVVTRADGTVEDLGVISYHHKNPLKRLVWRVFGKAL